MSISTDWAELYQGRIDWAYAAQSRFLASFHDPGLQRVHRSGPQHDLFVAVFGPSQVGKTTLILRLIGIAPAYVARVSEALRGGRDLGQSATITATQYARSPDDRYYVQGPGVESPVPCDGETELAAELGRLREQVVHDPSFSAKSIEIQLPAAYFQEQAVGIAVRMVDLPGIDSRSQDERHHVQKAIRYYVPAANLVLLVDKASKITNFGRTTAFDRINSWRQEPERFQIILTYAISEDSVQKLVKQVGPEAFQAYFKHEFERSVPGFPEQMKVYTLEFGQSWERFRQRGRVTPELDASMDQEFARLQADIAKSADARSQLKMNYRFYDKVKPRIEWHRKEYQAKSDALMQKIDRLKQRLAVRQQHVNAAREHRSALNRCRDTQPPVGPEQALPMVAPFAGKRRASLLRAYLDQAVTDLSESATEQFRAYKAQVFRHVNGAIPSFVDQSEASISPWRREALVERANPLLQRLKQHWPDWYVWSWNQYLTETNQLINELRQQAQQELEKAVRAYRCFCHSAVEEQFQRSAGRLVLYQRGLTRIQQKTDRWIQEHEELAREWAEFERNAPEDEQTAKEFLRFIQESFAETYGRYVQLINQPETPVTRRWLYAAHLAVLQKEYGKLKESR